MSGRKATNPGRAICTIGRELIESVEEVAELQNHAPPGAGRHDAADPFRLVIDEEQTGVGILEPADAEVDGPEVLSLCCRSALSLCCSACANSRGEKL